MFNDNTAYFSINERLMKKEAIQGGLKQKIVKEIKRMYNTIWYASQRKGLQKVSAVLKCDIERKERTAYNQDEMHFEVAMIMFQDHQFIISASI